MRSSEIRRLQLIELGAALNGCLDPKSNRPHYTFVDPRALMHPDGMQGVLDQALAVVEGLEKKGMSKEKIYVSVRFLIGPKLP